MDVRESRICPFLSSDTQQSCPLSMKIGIQDTEALFDWRGTTQPRSDGTVEKLNRTDYLKATAKPKLYVQLFCKGLQLSYHLGHLDIAFLLVNMELGHIYLTKKKDGIRIRGNCLQKGLLFCLELWLGYDTASKTT